MRKSDTRLARRLCSFTLSLVALATWLTAGCANGRRPDYHSEVASPVARIERSGGVEISIDPFIERDRTRRYFGISAIDDGIAIVHVRVVNRTPDHTVLLAKKNFHLLLAGATSDTSAAAKVDRSTAAGESVAWMGASVGSVGLVFIGASLMSQSMEIRRNFVSKEMPDQTLPAGQSMEGFIYYTPVPKGRDWTEGATMKVDFTETKTLLATEVSIPLSR